MSFFAVALIFNSAPQVSAAKPNPGPVYCHLLFTNTGTKKNAVRIGQILQIDLWLLGALHVTIQARLATAQRAIVLLAVAVSAKKSTKGSAKPATKTV
jgi:hypothetical protein